MNKIILVGNLTKDSDLKFAAGTGTAIGKFTIAVQRQKKDDGADFLNCVWFGKGAEACSQYLVKGTKVAICGHIQTGSYDNKEGQKVYTTDVIVESLEFVGSKKTQEEAQQEVLTDSGFSDYQPVDDGDIPF